MTGIFFSSLKWFIDLPRLEFLFSQSQNLFGIFLFLCAWSNRGLIIAPCGSYYYFYFYLLIFRSPGVGLVNRFHVWLCPWMADRNFIVGGWPIIIQQSETGKRTRVIIQSSSDYTTRKPSCLIRKTGSNRVPFVYTRRTRGVSFLLSGNFLFPFFGFRGIFREGRRSRDWWLLLLLLLWWGPQPRWLLLLGCPGRESILLSVRDKKKPNKNKLG